MHKNKNKQNQTNNKQQKTVIHYLMMSLIYAGISLLWIQLYLLPRSLPHLFPFLSSFCSGASRSPIHFHFLHCPSRTKNMLNDDVDDGNIDSSKKLSSAKIRDTKQNISWRQIPAFWSVPPESPVSWSFWPLDLMIHTELVPDIAFLEF